MKPFTDAVRECRQTLLLTELACTLAAEQCAAENAPRCADRSQVMLDCAASCVRALRALDEELERDWVAVSGYFDACAERCARVAALYQDHGHDEWKAELRVELCLRAEQSCLRIVRLMTSTAGTGGIEPLPETAEKTGRLTVPGAARRVSGIFSPAHFAGQSRKRTGHDK